MKRIPGSGVGGPWRALFTVALVLFVGAVGGYWLRGGAANKPDASATVASAAGNVWYTCGMHSQVLQREPGNCPICGMTLTPLKRGDEGTGQSSSGPQERKILYWRDPMDPSHVSDRPGKDPMGMDLAPVYADEGETVGRTVLRIDPVTIQNMGIRTARLRRGPLVRTIRTVGRVDYDEQKVVFVDTKVSGWIEKLYADETGKPVSTGDPLFDVYSPDLWQAQIEFISAARKLPMLERSTFPEAVEDAKRMVEAAKLKLEYFDVSADQIEKLRESLTPEKTLQIRSPADGIISEKMALEGTRVMPGMRLFTIADLSRVWAYVDIYEYQLPWVHMGQPATMTLPYIPGRVFRGKVAYIYPYLQQQTRVIKVRLEFDNPTLELKPDMYANIVLEGILGDNALLIPREGYIDSGMRQVAFVDRGGGKFEPRDIQVGVEGEGGMVEVLFGLDEGEVIVTSGQFLLDAESKLKEAVAKMLEPTRAAPRSAKPASAPHDHAAHAAQASTSRPSLVPPDAAYACPMEKHPAEQDPAKQGPYFAGGPGECPLCGMKLQPINELDWVQSLEAAAGADVAYTCPKHPQVFSRSPGECPRCGDKLEPFKLIYTCPNPKHAGQTSETQDDCPICGEPMATFRGPWLSEGMAHLNLPAQGVAQLGAASQPSVQSTQRSVPAGARFVCSMEECWEFSEQEGDCPKCGMKLKSIAEVSWAARLARAAIPPAKFVCPMHPEQATSDKPGFCPICSMQLVPVEDVIGLESGEQRVERQVDFLMEHYLGLHNQLAADRMDQLASNALGMVDASETLREALRQDQRADRDELLDAVNRLHAAALQITGRELAPARTWFAELSAAMRTIVAHQRPDSRRWPRLYIYHCPTSQADWIQATEKKANPYYGFKMLDSGKLLETK